MTETPRFWAFWTAGTTAFKTCLANMLLILIEFNLDFHKIIDFQKKI